MQQTEVVDFSCIISCLCPLSFSKVRDPVRGPRCHHIRFFDRESFIELYGAVGEGPCPICLKRTRVDELVEDSYIRSLLATTSEDEEFISITQEYSFDTALYSGVSDELQTGRTIPHPYESDVYLSGRVSHRYKTEDNHYHPIPQASSLSSVFFYKRIEAERVQHIERTRELKYWEYLEFYMSVLSKAIHLSSTEAFNPFIVFHKVDILQINAIQEVVDTVDAYCLSGSEMLVVISAKYYPSDEEENDLVARRYGFDDFIQRRSHAALESTKLRFRGKWAFQREKGGSSEKEDFYYRRSASLFGTMSSLQSSSADSMELCYCEGQGSVIACSSCGRRVHKECIPDCIDSQWQCDSCKEGAKEGVVHLCVLCQGNDPKYLFFRYLQGMNWVHGRCLAAFFAYLRDVCATTEGNGEVEADRSIPGKLSIGFSSLLHFFIRSGESAPVDRRQFVGVFNSLLSRLLPSPADSLDIAGTGACFRCKRSGGMLIKCRDSNCAFFFHPLCYEESVKGRSITDVIRNHEISCPLHQLRSSAPCKPFGGKAPRHMKKAATAGSSKPVTPVKPTQAKPVTPIKPTPQAKPTTPVKPTPQAKPVTPVKSTPQAKPVTPVKPTQPQDKSIPPPSPPRSAPADQPAQEEDNEVCDICREGYSEPGDMLVFCDRCNIAVHQGCYGIKEVPEGDWVCSVCAQGLQPSQVRCYICHQSGGAMHRTPEGFFIHLICAYYMPELSLNLNGPEVLVEGIARISRERAQLVCCLCGQKGAGCVQCSSRSCSVSFHPYCALKAGFLLTSDEKNGVFMYLCYCLDHTEKRRKKAERGTASADATPKKKRKMRRKKEKAKAVAPSIPDTMLQKWASQSSVTRRLKADEKQSSFWCVDFWTCMKYFYTVKPDPAPLVAQLHFLSAFPALPSPSAPSAWLPPHVLSYVLGVLRGDLLLSTPASLLRLLRSDSLFSIPALGRVEKARPQEVPSEERARSLVAAPRGASNTSIHRKQKLNFQGFDINDFADLRESHVCSLDYAFIAWARSRGVCAGTTFRIAHKADVPWLLKINRINPTFSSEADYGGTFYEKNEFVILAERKNAEGSVVPVGMVHFYLMWYYPCAGKQREAVRAVYVCTLQRVSRATHAAFVSQYHVEAEHLTGTMLLCLAFRQGQACQMSMGCCDSTDNSVSFYTQQFGMAALPRGEGRHYTPMQIPLSAFDARSVLLKHLPSPFHGTLLCRLRMPVQQPPVSVTAQPSPVLHLQLDEAGRLQSTESLATPLFTPSHQYLLHHYPQRFAPTQTAPGQRVTSLGRVCSRDDEGRWSYLLQGVPHFCELADEAEGDLGDLGDLGTMGDEPDCCIDSAVYMAQNGCVIDSNEVERELEAAQSELFATECQNERGLCGLLASLVSSEAESEATLRLVEESERLAKELREYEVVNRPDRVKEEEEEDNDAICEVCGDGDSNFGNVIIFCDGCDAAVHQCCYDLAQLPRGDWFCNVCEDILVKKLGVRDVMHVTPKESADDGIAPAVAPVDSAVDSAVDSVLDSAMELETESSAGSVLDRLHELREKVFCCICGYSKGAMMRTNEQGKYAHVACALWHPCCSVSNAMPCCREEVLVPAVEEAKAPAASTPSEAKTPSSEDTVLIPILAQPAQSAQSEQSEQPAQVMDSTPPTQSLQPAQPAQPAQPPPSLVAYHSPYDGLRANTELPRYCIDISRLGEQRRSLACQLCRRKGGVVPCCCSGCSRGVHASCALKYELELFWNNKIGHSGVPVEEVLVEKDFFLHCFHHSGGFQGRGVPHKRCDEYSSPISEKEGRRKRQNDEFVLAEAQDAPAARQRRSRRSVAASLEVSQQQGLERMRKKREKRRERERKRNDSARGRRRRDENALVFTTKPHSKKERRQRLVLEWLKARPCAQFLMDDANNLLLKIQRQIDSHLLPRHADWHGYTVDNGTLQSFYRRCKKRGFFQVHDLVIEIREIFLGLLSYCYPAAEPEKQAVAKLVCSDANELTRLMIQLDNPFFFAHHLKDTEVFCICMTTDGTSEFMVGCDACGRWFHPFCIGFAETKYFGFLTTYDHKFVDVREETGCFFCPMCYEGENVAKMKLYSEEEVLAMGVKEIPGYQESVVEESLPVVQSSVPSTSQPIESSDIQPSMEVVPPPSMEVVTPPTTEAITQPSMEVITPPIMETIPQQAPQPSDSTEQSLDREDKRLKIE